MWKGETLLQLKGLSQKDGNVEGFTNQLRQALMVEAKVKRLQQNTELLILDNEESVSAKEIAQAVGAISHVTIQKMRDGGPLAKVQVPIEKGMEVLKRGQQTITWSRCKISSLQKRNTLPHCYKCLRMGQMARECTNADLQ